ncbi:histidine kinase N-terminal 7TM domain-containing protein [Natronomonas gomsonensis]|uniref:histidine kinase N-terminal 7TM domain-containing protein n=1 Tax=Natronomonas gomsonensis TaxID=1046043 RepID=UPI0015B81B05
MITHPTYVVAFGAAATACFAAVYRAGWLATDEASIGLRALLVTTGLWSVVQTLVLLAPSESLMLPLYLVGQAVGFASVGAWLYFCSAYTGRSLHRQSRYWLAGLSTYAVVTTIKLTQPIHGAYVDTRLATEPLRYLIVEPGVLYWGFLALAYALAGVGFYWLYELFARTERSTNGLALLVGTTALPAVPTVLSFLRPRQLIPMHYEPLGMALFAFGALYLVHPTFFEVHDSDRHGVVDTE